MTDSDAPTQHNTALIVAAGLPPEPDGSPAALGVGEQRKHELAGPSGEVRPSKSPVWAVFQRDEYELNPILFLSPCFAPAFLSLSSERAEPAIICLWHIFYHIFYAYFEFHLQNQQLMCMLCIESYICISVCTFYLIIEFWYCMSAASVNFIGPGPSPSHRIGFDAIGRCGSCSCRGPGCGRLRHCNKCQRSHSGWEDTRFIPRSSGLREAGMWSVLPGIITDGGVAPFAAAAPSPPPSSFLGIKESAPVAAIVTTFRCSGGCLIELTALSLSMCHFTQIVLMNFCINSGLFWPAVLILSATFKFVFFVFFPSSLPSVIWSQHSLFIWGTLFLFRDLIMPYRDSMLGK